MRQESYFQLERDSRTIVNAINQKPTEEMDLYSTIGGLFLSFMEREQIVPAMPKMMGAPDHLFSCYREWAVMVSLPMIHWTKTWDKIQALLVDRIPAVKSVEAVDPEEAFAEQMQRAIDRGAVNLHGLPAFQLKTSGNALDLPEIVIVNKEEASDPVPSL